MSGTYESIPSDEKAPQGHPPQFTPANESQRKKTLCLADKGILQANIRSLLHVHLPLCVYANSPVCIASSLNFSAVSDTPTRSMSPPLEPDSLLEDTIPQLTGMDHRQQQQQSPPAGTATAARSSVQFEGEGEGQQQDVPSPGRLDDFDFEGSLDAITTACPVAEGNGIFSSPSREGEGEGKAERTAAVTGAEGQEVR